MGINGGVLVQDPCRVVLAGAGCTVGLLGPFLMDVLLNFDAIRWVKERMFVHIPCPISPNTPLDVLAPYSRCAPLPCNIQSADTPAYRERHPLASLSL